MHAVHPTSIRTIDDKSGEVGVKTGYTYTPPLKDMLRVLVDPDHSRTWFILEKNPISLESAPHCFLIEDPGEDIHFKASGLPSESTLRLTDGDQLHMNSWTKSTAHQSEYLDDMSDRMPMTNGVVTKQEVCYWPEIFTSFESEKSRIQPHEPHYQPGSHSQHLSLQCGRTTTVLDDHSLQAESSASSITSRTQFGDKQANSGDTVALLHPVPKASLYLATSHFASYSGTEPELEIPSPASSQEYLSNTGKTYFQQPSWTHNVLGNASLFQPQGSPEGSSVAALEDIYTPVASTFSVPTPLPWSDSSMPVPWDLQHQGPGHTEANWVNTDSFPDMNHYYSPTGSELNQSFNGLPLSDDQHYTFPPTFLHPFRSHGCLNPSYDKEQNTTTTTRGTPQFQPHALNHENIYRLNQSPHPKMTTDGKPFRPEQLTRKIPHHKDTKNAFLIECKHRGLSYKDIKRIGGFKEAESTLRGRFRTLTKSKEQRVRKPQWEEKDVKLLSEAVNVCSVSSKQSSYCRPSSMGLPPRVSWKKVAHYIWTHGGSYHFGNATCKKKWCEVNNVQI